MGLDLELDLVEHRDAMDKITEHDFGAEIVVDGVRVGIKTRTIDFRLLADSKRKSVGYMRKNESVLELLMTVTGCQWPNEIIIIEREHFETIIAALDDHLKLPTDAMHYDAASYRDLSEFRSVMRNIQQTIDHETQFLCFSWIS